MNEVELIAGDTLEQFDTEPVLRPASKLRAEGQALLDAAQKIKDDASWRAAVEAIETQHAADPTRFVCPVKHRLTDDTQARLKRAGYTVVQQSFAEYRISW